MAFSNHYHQCIYFAFIFLLGALLCEATSRPLQGADKSMYQRHKQWMAKYGRVYLTDGERHKRFKIFKQNVELIDSFNSAKSKPYKLSVNQFADLTLQEFTTSRTGFKAHLNSDKATTGFKYENVTEIPSSMDWRQKGAVTPIKNQGPCGSCWAFSAVGAMEGITKLSTGKLISLSEQELVDCDVEVNTGCLGGYMDEAFKFIINNKGLTTESNYPYNGSQGKCNAEKEADHAAIINGYEDVPENNETALLKAVANQPVSVAIDSGNSHFMFYSSGILTGECGTLLNHAVTAVGYGVDESGIKYWLVKNSWGASWGENGYVRMQRDVDAKEGLCGIAMVASYPTI